jgi:hypothetical protein
MSPQDSQHKLCIPLAGHASAECNRAPDSTAGVTQVGTRHRHHARGDWAPLDSYRRGDDHRGRPGRVRSVRMRPGGAGIVPVECVARCVAEPSPRLPERCSASLQALPPVSSSRLTPHSPSLAAARCRGLLDVIAQQPLVVADDGQIDHHLLRAHMQQTRSRFRNALHSIGPIPLALWGAKGSDHCIYFRRAVVCLAEYCASASVCVDPHEVEEPLAPPFPPAQTRRDLYADAIYNRLIASMDMRHLCAFVSSCPP